MITNYSVIAATTVNPEVTLETPTFSSSLRDELRMVATQSPNPVLAEMMTGSVVMLEAVPAMVVSASAGRSLIVHCWNQT